VDRTAASDPPPRYYFTKDRLNSTRELVSASATVVTSYDYDVWGSPTESHLSGNISTHYQFTGRPYREASSLHYYRARYLAHNVGRFISRDPLWHLTRRAVQLYPYVGNNPATFVDPSGLLGEMQTGFEVGQEGESEGGDVPDCCSQCIPTHCDFVTGCYITMTCVNCVCHYDVDCTVDCRTMLQQAWRVVKGWWEDWFEMPDRTGTQHM